MKVSKMVLIFFVRIKIKFVKKICMYNIKKKIAINTYPFQPVILLVINPNTMPELGHRYLIYIYIFYSI